MFRSVVSFLVSFIVSYIVSGYVFLLLLPIFGLLMTMVLGCGIAFACGCAAADMAQKGLDWVESRPAYQRLRMSLTLRFYRLLWNLKQMVPA